MDVDRNPIGMFLFKLIEINDAINTSTPPIKNVAIRLFCALFPNNIFEKLAATIPRREILPIIADSIPTNTATQRYRRNLTNFTFIP